MGQYKRLPVGRADIWRCCIQRDMLAGRSGRAPRCVAMGAGAGLPVGRGLHSFTSQLNLSAL